MPPCLFIISAILLAPAFGLLFARAALGFLLKTKNVFLLYVSTGGVGDTVAMTALMRAIREQRGANFWVVTAHTELLENNPWILRAWERGTLPARLVVLFLRIARPPNTHNFRYKTSRARREERGRHLVAVAADGLRNPPDLSDPRGAVFLTDAERAAAREKFSPPGAYAIVVPEGKTSFTPNKEWGAENFAALVRAMPEVNWVQAGAPENVLLPGVLDFRGRTTLRELACLISGACVVVAGEGLHNHLCAALGVPSVVVLSGFHPGSFVRYSVTELVFSPPPPCAPCWLKTPCPVPGKPCMAIEVENVRKIIKEKIPWCFFINTGAL